MVPTAPGKRSAPIEQIIWHSSLTSTVTAGIGDGLGGIRRRASLVGAITDTVAKIGVVAVARDVSSLAVELGLGDVDHVVEA